MINIDNKGANPEIAAMWKNHVYNIIGCCQTVHREMGPWLNEYIYQEALKIALEEKSIPFRKEFYFMVTFHGKPLEHKHYIDFLCMNDVAVECKAITSLGVEQRQQLWNYMRLSQTPFGILYNFTPVKDQCEKYHLDTVTNVITAF